MAEELKKMGADVEEQPDGLVIHQSELTATRLDGRSDHRIVMALSLAGMAIDGVTTIDTAEAMSVTFPEYANLMRSLGADVEIGGQS
jgi:3-phosphoshikimate 1-carboxyvinyltransferase